MAGSDLFHDLRFEFLVLEMFHVVVNCFNEVARRGVFLAASTPRATGFVCQRLSVFKTFSLS